MRRAIRAVIVTAATAMAIVALAALVEELGYFAAPFPDPVIGTAWFVGGFAAIMATAAVWRLVRFRGRRRATGTSLAHSPDTLAR